VTADLSGLKKGENTVHLSVSLPDNVNLKSISDGTIKVTIEDLVSVEKPVQVKYVGTISDGEEPGGVTISPETVVVSGAESTVDDVKYVAASVDVDDIAALSKTLDATLEPVDKDGEVLSYLTLSQDQVQVDVAMLVTKTVPLELDITGSVPSGYTLDSKDYPETITIKGAANAVKDIDSITGDAIDISDLTDSTKINIQLNLPTGIEVTWDSEDPVLKLVISAASSQTFTYDSGDLTLKGLDTGLTSDVASTSITLTVKSTTESLSDISADDFTLSLDLSDLAAGTHKVPITVTTQLSDVTYTVSPEKIKVTLSEE
jgi:YbbR domain-containing protein